MAPPEDAKGRTSEQTVVEEDVEGIHQRETLRDSSRDGCKRAGECQAAMVKTRKPAVRIRISLPFRN